MNIALNSLELLQIFKETGFVIKKKRNHTDIVNDEAVNVAVFDHVSMKNMHQGRLHKHGPI